MPIRKVKGGFKYGGKGKIYKKRGDAVKQMRAIQARQYKK